jgi:hypothetical protein
LDFEKTGFKSSGFKLFGKAGNWLRGCVNNMNHEFPWCGVDLALNACRIVGIVGFI